MTSHFHKRGIELTCWCIWFLNLNIHEKKMVCNVMKINGFIIYFYGINIEKVSE